jgi:hypothetical protein
MRDSNHPSLYINIYSSSSDSPHTNTAESSRPEKLSVQRGISCNGWDGTVDDQPGESRRRQSGSSLWERFRDK